MTNTQLIAHCFLWNIENIQITLHSREPLNINRFPQINNSLIEVRESIQAEYLNLNDRFKEGSKTIILIINMKEVTIHRDRNSTSITNFIPLNKIGEGSFSSVYKVRRISDDQIYALKKIKIAELKEKEKQNALNEIRILASLNSPYIIEYREAFFDEKLHLLCVVMELANEGDLQKMIESNQKTKSQIPEAQVWKAIYCMLSGLLILHRNSILHRDIKSANIFISDGVYKLGDLNVSKIQDHESRLAYTQTGTPYYASPEVWRDEPYGQKSDMWSLGCVIYEMCTGKPPFKGKDLESLYKNVQKNVYERIPQQYSKQLSDLISFCLRKDQKSRLSCQQLLSLPLLQKKCCEHNINIEKEEIKEQLLKTIKLPLNLKDLHKKLPKSKYSTSMEEKQYKKTLIKLHRLEPLLQTHASKNKRITSEQSIERNPEQKVHKKQSLSKNERTDSKEMTPRSDRSKKEKNKNYHLKQLLLKRNESEYMKRKYSQDSARFSKEVQNQHSLLKKLSQPAERCLSQRYLEDLSGVFKKDSSTDRLEKKRSLQKKNEEELAELERKVEVKRRELRKIGSIQRMTGLKSIQHQSYKQPLALHSKIKESAAHISQILKAPSSAEDEASSSYINKIRHKKLLPQVPKVSSTPYLYGISGVGKMKKSLDVVHEESNKKYKEKMKSPYRYFH